MSELRRYKVKLIKSPEGFAVNCPELPGCWSQGRSEKDALASIAEAIKDYLASIDEELERERIELEKEDVQLTFREVLVAV